MSTTITELEAQQVRMNDLVAAWARMYPQAQAAERERQGPAAERVARGVAWLDSDFPGWRDEITDLEGLDIANGCRCVLGQVYRAVGGYSVTAEHMRREGLEPAAYGFAGYDPELNTCWRTAIHDNSKVAA